MSWKFRAALLVLSAALTNVTQAGSISSSMVPTEVKNTFANMFPTAVVTKWDYDEDARGYEVDARMGKAEIEVLLAENGQLIRSKEDVAVQNIPEKILKTVREKWSRAEILGANKITTPQGIKWDVGLRVRSQYHNVEIPEH